MGRLSKNHRVERDAPKAKKYTHNQGKSTDFSTDISADEAAFAVLAKKIQQKKAAKERREREESQKQLKKMPVIQTFPLICLNIGLPSD